MPMTNSGRAAIDRLPIVTETSNFVSRRSAVIEPRSSEMGMLNRAAMKTSVKVFWTRRARSSVTGSSCHERVPEVALDDAAEPAEVLGRHGLVEPELLAQGLVAGLVGRLPAEDRAGGVAGESLRRDEDDHRDQEQRQDPEPEPDEDQLQKRGHGSRLPLSVLLIMMAASRAGATGRPGSRGCRDRSHDRASVPAALVARSEPRARGRAPRPRPLRYSRSAHEVDVLEVHPADRTAELVQLVAGGRLGVGVDLVAPRPDDVAARVELDLLRLGDELVARCRRRPS